MEEQDNELRKGWLEHSFTRSLVKHYEKKLHHLMEVFHSTAARSTDPDVREKYVQVVATRVVLAELQGKDTIEGAGQQ